MKKILLLLTLASGVAVAGTLTIFQNPGGSNGSITIATGPNGLGFLHEGRNSTGITFNVSITSFTPAGTTDILGALRSESEVQVPYHSAGVMSNFSADISNNSLTAGSSITVRVNGVSGNELILIPATSTGIFTDASHVDNIPAGALVDYMVTTPSGGTHMIVNGIWVSFLPPTNNMMKMVGSLQGYTSTVNGFASFYEPIAGELRFSGVIESSRAYVMKTPGTFSHFGVYCSSNTRAVSTVINFRHNGANGNQSVTVPGGFTGLIEDSSDADTVVVGDSVDVVAASVGSDAGIFELSFQDSEFTSGANRFMEYPAPVPQGQTLSAGATNYFPVLGKAGNGVTLEATVQTPSTYSGTYSHMHTYINTNTLSVGMVITFRKNGVNGNQTITVPAGSTGYFEDAVDSDTVSSSDLVDYDATATAGTGAASPSYFGTSFTQ